MIECVMNIFTDTSSFQKNTLVVKRKFAQKVKLGQVPVTGSQS